MSPAAAAAKLLQSCPTLSDPMDCSLPGSSIHGIVQARVLEWGAIEFSEVYLGRVQKWPEIPPIDPCMHAFYAVTLQFVISRDGVCVSTP